MFAISRLICTWCSMLKRHAHRDPSWQSLDFLKLVERAAFHRQIGFKIFLPPPTWARRQWVMMHYVWVSVILSHHRAGPMSIFVENTYQLYLYIENICIDRNWPVTCVSNQPFKIGFWLQTQARTWKPELQKGP